MRLKIGKKIYPPLELDAVNLKDIILFAGEVRDLSADLSWTWGDVLAFSQKLEGFSESEIAVQPDWPLFLGSMVWAARRLADEDVTFSEAVDFDPNTVDFIEDPEDHQQGKAKAAKKPPRKASGLAVAPDADEGEPKTSVQADSESPSIPA